MFSEPFCPELGVARHIRQFWQSEIDYGRFSAAHRVGRIGTWLMGRPKRILMSGRKPPGHRAGARRRQNGQGALEAAVVDGGYALAGVASGAGLPARLSSAPSAVSLRCVAGDDPRGAPPAGAF
jgi:hypothetical protein